MKIEIQLSERKMNTYNYAYIKNNYGVYQKLKKENNYDGDTDTRLILSTPAGLFLAHPAGHLTELVGNWSDEEYSYILSPHKVTFSNV
jgi:hypothetical protein